MDPEEKRDLTRMYAGFALTGVLLIPTKASYSPAEDATYAWDLAEAMVEEGERREAKAQAKETDNA